jgi:hypothetical protein
MSVDGVDRVCRDLLHDEAFRAAMLRAPEETLTQRDLTEAEIAALREGDVRTLYRMGANAYLMGNLFRFGIFGLTLDAFNSRMREEQGHAGASVMHRLNLL